MYYTKLQVLYADGTVSVHTGHWSSPRSRSNSPQRAGSARSQDRAETPTKKGGIYLTVIYCYINNIDKYIHEVKRQIGSIGCHCWSQQIFCLWLNYKFWKKGYQAKLLFLNKDKFYSISIFHLTLLFFISDFSFFHCF